MDKNVIIAQMENRIKVLENRPKDNANVIRKLNRQIRNLKRQTA